MCRSASRLPTEKQPEVAMLERSATRAMLQCQCAAPTNSGLANSARASAHRCSIVFPSAKPGCHPERRRAATESKELRLLLSFLSGEICKLTHDPRLLQQECIVETRFFQIVIPSVAPPWPACMFVTRSMDCYLSSAWELATYLAGSPVHYLLSCSDVFTTWRITRSLQVIVGRVISM